MKQLLIFFITFALAVSCGFSVGPIPQTKVRNTSNQIDQYLASHLQAQQLKANPIINDATFVRRAYINIIGRIPTAKEARSFIENPAPEKRQSLIDTLIQSDGYRSRMFNFWADLLRLKTNLDKHGLGWHIWIQDAVDQNMPYDDFVNTMLSSQGLATDNPAVGYYLRDRDMLLDNVSNTAQVFLGTQIGCAQCHDHPFDDWTQKQYYELAAFTGNTVYNSATANHLLRNLVKYSLEKDGTLEQKPERLGKKKFNQVKKEGKKYYKTYSYLFRDFRKVAVSESPDQVLRLPKDYQYNDGKPGDILVPKTPFGESIPDNIPLEQRRQAFADWVTSEQNPLFTKVIVNRLWAEVFGRGIVDPLDNWSDTTRISHPELLDYLCTVMRAIDYDTGQFMRILYHTRLFESKVSVEEAKMGGHYDFRGPILRRMSAEEVYDSFLTLESGNRDNNKNEAFAYRWRSYVQSVDELFNMSIPELIQLSEETQSIKEISDRAKSEAAQLRTQARQAEAEGDTERANELTKKAKQKMLAFKKLQTKGKSMMATNIMQKQMRTNSRTSIRASEQGSPSKPGSFLRQFGASDRMTPDASNNLASTPQALTLLNSNEIAKLTDGKGQLATLLRQAKSPGERLDVLFLSIYSSLPTDAERNALEPLVANPTSLTTLARAMVSSKRFLFIQ
ncbi:MAG: DUF1549 domain-containing protein [Akkermansiaceae bacterium]